MRDMFLLILGSALGLVGSIATHRYQAKRDEDRWYRERHEDRRKDAATALATLWNLVASFLPDSFLIHYDPDRSPQLLMEIYDKWEALGPSVRRISILDRTLEPEIAAIVDSVNEMIGLTRICMWQLTQHLDFQPDLQKVKDAKGRATTLIGGVADRLADEEGA